MDEPHSHRSPAPRLRSRCVLTPLPALLVALIPPAHRVVSPRASLLSVLCRSAPAASQLAMQRAATVLSRQSSMVPRAAFTAAAAVAARPLAATVLPAHCSSSGMLRRSLHSRSAAAMASRSTPLHSPAAATALPSDSLTPADPSFPQASSDADADLSAEASARPYERSIARTWHLFDARDQIVGRMAGHIAKLLQGKHRPSYTPWIDHGDCVVVLNARYLQFTGKKWQQKLYRYHTGYPGGLKEIPAERWRTTHPDRILRHAIAGMIKKNKLKVPRLARLKIYPGLLHPHAAQFPEDIIAKVPHLKAQRDEEIAAEAAAKQKERDAFTLAANAGKKPAAAAEKKAPADAAKSKTGALLDTSDDTIVPADPVIRTAILKDREARKGKPSAHSACKQRHRQRQCRAAREQCAGSCAEANVLMLALLCSCLLCAVW